MTFREMRDIQLRGADRYVAWAVERLNELKNTYRNSDLEPLIVQARLSAIQSKIDALNAVKLDPDAHPWAADV
jgi:hypothetical protein